MPPIKCTSTRVTIGNIRYRIWSNGDISYSLRPDQMEVEGVKTLGDLIQYEKSHTLYFAYQQPAAEIRKESQRLRRNKLSRERNQAMRDLGMKKTPYGWE